MGSLSAFVLSGLTGVGLELGIHALSGRREAWDSPLYWTLGLPTVCAISLLIGFLSRGRSWRWTLAIVPFQLLTMMAESGEIGSMAPLGAAFGAILSLPFFGIAFVGSWMRTRVAPRIGPTVARS